MNILHLLSQNSLTGAEVYSNDLAHQQKELGHQVYQISNDFFSEGTVTRVKLPVEVKNFIQFYNSQKALIHFIKQHHIQVIHAHSRAASKMAHRLAKKLKIGYVSSVHGRQHISWSKKIFNAYGTYIIPVCPNIAFQLTSEFNYKSHLIKTIPNGVNTEKFNFKNKTAELKNNQILKIAVIGRLNGPKKDRTEIFIDHLTPLLKANNMSFEWTVIGSGKLKTEVPHKQIDHAEITSDFLHQFDVVCGSGRVAIESVMTGIPTIAFGENHYCGLVTETNWDLCIQSNFGDIGKDFSAPQINLNQAQQDLKTLFNFSGLEKEKLSRKCVDYFNLKRVTEKIIRLYESAYFKAHVPNWIPILMYHKVPDQDLASEHKIFVNKNNFEKHLQFFKKINFKTLTFGDLKQFRTGQRSFKEFPKKPLILTFDDGYVDNLLNAKPLLNKYGFKAQVFLLANQNIDSNTWDQKTASTVESSAAEKHMIVTSIERQKWICPEFEIGSHGLNHNKMPLMSRYEKILELTESKKSLEKEFGQKITTFAFTYGDTDEECAECCQEAGYDYGVNTDQGGLHLEDDPYSIFRVNMFPHETKTSLWKKTSTWYRKYYQFKRHK